VLTDGHFTLYESNAIVEYIEEAYPGRGAPLFPGDVKTRAFIRRLIQEVDNYYYAASEKLLVQALFTKPEDRDAKAIADGRESAVVELGNFAKAMRGDYLAGPLSAADFALYPMVAMLRRAQLKLPDLDADAMLPPPIKAWRARIEALPFFDKTIPPHWKAG
jgi:glutathione S-transferase